MTATTLTSALPGPVRRRSIAQPGFGVLALTYAGAFLVSLDVSVANALLPAIGTTFHTRDRATLAWIITAYAIVLAAALVPAGRIADRVGRRRSYLAGLVLFAVGSALCGLATDTAMLIAGRIVQGTAAAAVSPASLGLLLAVVNGAQRSTYASRWAGAAALGICAGPILGGTLTTAVGWRWVFLVNLPLIAVMCATHRRLAETPRQPGRAVPDLVGALLLAIGTAAVTYGISESPARGLGDGTILASLLGGVALVSLFVRRSLRVPAPLLDLRLLARRATALAILTTALYSAAFFGLLLTFVLFLVGPWQFSLLNAGLAILPIGLIVAAMTFRVGGLPDRFGFRLPLATGAALMAAGLLLATVCLGARFSPAWLIVAVVIGIGIGLCYPLLVAAALVGLPATDLAAATAVSQSARQIGAALGIAVAVAALGPADLPSLAHFHVAWLVATVFCAIAAVSALSMGKAS